MDSNNDVGSSPSAASAAISAASTHERDRVLNLPILLTWARVAAIPAMIAMYYLPIDAQLRDSLATFIFVAAAFTDLIDGWLARKWNQTTAFGAFLDPVADKLIVTAALIYLVALGRLSPFLASVLVMREIAIASLREWMAEKQAKGAVRVDWFGKMKTRAQLVGISMLMYDQTFLGFIDCRQVGPYVIYLAVGLSLLSMGIYFFRSYAALGTTKAQRSHT